MDVNNLLISSVTRYGEISPLWQNFERLWRIKSVYLVFGKSFRLISNAIGQIFFASNGQILEK